MRYDWKALVVCFVAGVVIGLSPIIFVQPGRLRYDLRQAESNAQRSLERVAELRATIDRLTERQQEAAAIIERASGELADATQRASRLTDLIAAAIELVEQLEHASDTLRNPIVR